MAFTYFFRDMHTLQLIEQQVIPQVKNRRYLNIWDAGCATGAEPYSIAMLFRENMSEFLFRNVRICATDIDEHFGAVIRNGMYREEEVKRLPAGLLGKYFAPAEAPDHYQIAEPIRNAVSFQKHDLTSLQPIRDDFCLIVCKNVLLHIRGEQVVEIVRMFRGALAKGGFLAVEQTQILPPEASCWFRRVTPNGQVFQRV
jgi:chemotaxis protein methyltransferase CheR